MVAMKHWMLPTELEAIQPQQSGVPWVTEPNPRLTEVLLSVCASLWKRPPGFFFWVYLVEMNVWHRHDWTEQTNRHPNHNQKLENTHRGSVSGWVVANCGQTTFENDVHEPSFLSHLDHSRNLWDVRAVILAHAPKKTWASSSVGEAPNEHMEPVVSNSSQAATGNADSFPFHQQTEWNGGRGNDNDNDNHTQRSPTSVKWRPGLTGVSVGVMTPRKKRICCPDEACSIGKVCTNPLLRTVCSTSNHEMNSKEHITTHRLWLERIHEFKSLESSDSEQHNEEVRETKRGRADQGNQEKKTHPKRKLAGTVAHQSLLFPNQISCFGTRKSYSISSSFVENSSHCAWPSNVNPSRSSWMQVCCCFQMRHFVDAYEAGLRSCCVSRSRHLISLWFCDVGCFFVTQSHSIKVSRWSSAFFCLFSTSVVLTRSLCKFLLVEPILHSEGLAAHVLSPFYLSHHISLLHCRSPSIVRERLLLAVTVVDFPRSRLSHSSAREPFWHCDHNEQREPSDSELSQHASLTSW